MLLKWWIFILVRAFEQERARRKRTGGAGCKRFRSHVLPNYTPARRSRIYLELILATMCVVFRSRVLMGLLYARCWV